MKIPQSLKKGDTIAIISPAKHIESEYILNAKVYWEKFDYNVLIGKYAEGQNHYFSGTIQERSEDLQAALNNDNVKAILCARGGYGSLDLVDVVNWAGMLLTPKWLVGFSDITVFHQKLNKLNIASLHATMPLNYAENTPESLQSLRETLEGKSLTYDWSSPQFKKGINSGILLGGNLAIIHALIGTNDQPDYSGAILFIEEVGEYLYGIDRMFYSLSKAGILEKINGLVVGGMTNIKDTEPPFGLSLEEMILKHFPYRKIPIAFDFPAGHIQDNRALILGKQTRFEVTEKGQCTFNQ
ncbi:MAG: S66 peptidase family protein [Lishizhenia sp.]